MVYNVSAGQSGDDKPLQNITNHVTFVRPAIEFSSSYNPVKAI